MKNRVADAIYVGVAMVLLVLVAAIQTPRKSKSQKFCRRFFSLDWGLIFTLAWLAVILHWGYVLWNI